MSVGNIHEPGISSASQLHLYLAWACPFCHRVLAAMRLSGVRNISVTWMRNIKRTSGWEIARNEDPLFSATSLKTVYERLSGGGAVRYSVPLLVEKYQRKFVSNDSAEISRYIASGLNGISPINYDLVPKELSESINELNCWLHHNVNRRVYRVGLAVTPLNNKYHLTKLFAALDLLEQRLSGQVYLFGDRLTESDLFLFATLIRFDAVYYELFNCRIRRIADYQALSAYLARMLDVTDLKTTFDSELIREHYACSVMHVNGEVRRLNRSGWRLPTT